MQRVWRGERPQAGRFREFYQCDIDVINIDTLPLHYDAEMPSIIWEVLSSLPGMDDENIQIRISNRKILMGLLDSLGIDNKVAVTRIVDKREKMSTEEFDQHITDLNIAPDASAVLTDLVRIKSCAKDCPELLRDFIARNDVIAKSTSDTALQTLNEGIDELSFVMNQLSHLPESAVIADLSIVRGLDYYTGTVYETVFVDDPGYGSICSGGRYDDLASGYINKHLPGVGISIGFSRLFSRLKEQQKLPPGRLSPADILVVMPNEGQRTIATDTAKTLRQRGYNVELAHGGKLKKQLAYAEKKSIPYVWFPPFEDGADHEVKNMNTGKQIQSEPETWTA